MRIIFLYKEICLWQPNLLDFFSFLTAMLSNFFFFCPHCLACSLHYAWLAQAAGAIEEFVDLKLTQ